MALRNTLPLCCDLCRIPKLSSMLSTCSWLGVPFRHCPIAFASFFRVAYERRFLSLNMFWGIRVIDTIVRYLRYFHHTGGCLNIFFLKTAATSENSDLCLIQRRSHIEHVLNQNDASMTSRRAHARPRKEAQCTQFVPVNNTRPARHWSD